MQKYLGLLSLALVLASCRSVKESCSNTLDLDERQTSVSGLISEFRFDSLVIWGIEGELEGCMLLPADTLKDKSRKSLNTKVKPLVKIYGGKKEVQRNDSTCLERKVQIEERKEKEKDESHFKIYVLAAVWLLIAIVLYKRTA